jgi:hypothetical protein
VSEDGVYPLPMDTTELQAWLRYPAYGLYHLRSLEDSARGGYAYDLVPTFSERFDAESQQCILAALVWAMECDHLDWEAVLPQLPHSDDFRRQHCRITRERILETAAE